MKEDVLGVDVKIDVLWMIGHRVDFFYPRGDYGSGRALKNCPLVGSDQNFESEARYFGPKWAGFSGQNRTKPRNRLKSYFWLVQSKKNLHKTRPKIRSSSRAGVIYPLLCTLYCLHDSYGLKKNTLELVSLIYFVISLTYSVHFRR